LQCRGSSAVGRGRAGWLARPRPTALLPPSSDGKLEAATAVVVAPDDERKDARNMKAVHTSRSQVINVRNCCIWLVDLFENYLIMVHNFIS
jgi:hypothetical protein